MRAYGGPRFQVTQRVMKDFADAIAQAKVDVVPKIVMGGGQGQSGSVVETLLALLLSDKLEEATARPTDRGVRAPELDAMRTRIRDELFAAKACSASAPISGAPRLSQQAGAATLPPKA